MANIDEMRISVDDLPVGEFDDWEHPVLQRRAERPASIEDAMILIWQILRINKSSIIFTPAYPDLIISNPLTQDVEDAPQIPDELISWSVIRMDPASTTGNAFGGRKELRPRLREEGIPNRKEVALGYAIPETEIVTYGQSFEILIQFDCFAKTNFDAERLVTEFIKTMTIHAPTLIKFGVQKWYFWRRLRDTFLLKFRNGIIARSVQYYMKSEEISFVEVSKLKSIRLQLENMRSEGNNYPDWATRIKEKALEQVE
jgi:hypothetical protein